LRADTEFINPMGKIFHGSIIYGFSRGQLLALILKSMTFRIQDFQI